MASFSRKDRDLSKVTIERLLTANSIGSTVSLRPVDPAQAPHAARVARNGWAYFLRAEVYAVSDAPA